MKITPSPSTLGNQAWTGAISESLVQYRLNRYGFPTVSAGLQLPYDLITEVHGHYFKVQVKSSNVLTHQKKPVYRYQITCGKNKLPYPPGSVDMFAFVASDLEMCHFVLASDVPKQQTLRFDGGVFCVSEQDASLETTLSSLLAQRCPQ